MAMIHRAFALSALTLTACGAADQDPLESATQSITIDANATYHIVGVHSGKCVEVAGGSTGNLAPYQIASCSTDGRQRFKFEALGNGYYRIRNVNSGLCADVEYASTDNGARIVQYSCHTGYNQQWSITDVSNGAQRLTPRHSGKAMDVSGWGTADGTRLQQWSWANQTNQQFRLEVVKSTAKVFSQCRFHFGTIDSYARDNAAVRAEIDYFTPGWMGYQDTFDQSYVCNDTKAGGVLEGKVPVVVAYVAAFYAKRHANLCDCNVSTCGTGNDLCRYGSQYIQQNLNAILNVYRSYAQGYANCYGTSRPIVFEMEPDWYQYTYSSQTDPMTYAESASIMNQFVNAIKQYLPNAVFSMDISPWVAPNNGSDNGAQWYANFDMAQFTFINTSGGSTEAANTKIRSSNNMTWAGVSGVTGKPILADTGYGANGVSAGHDYNWDNPTYVNARMQDGVIGISQYNPTWNWGSTIQSIRSQLGTPKFCP